LWLHRPPANVLNLELVQAVHAALQPFAEEPLLAHWT
jgi:hypothetical protein